MRIAVSLAIILGIVLILIVHLAFPPYSKHAELRARTVLNGMQEGTGTGLKQQTAMCMWARDVVNLDVRELSWASDHFDRWRRDRNLYHSFNHYTIDKVELLPERQVPTVRVRFTVDDKDHFAMMVPDKATITWDE